MLALFTDEELPIFEEAFDDDVQGLSSPIDDNIKEIDSQSPFLSKQSPSPSPTLVQDSNVISLITEEGSVNLLGHFSLDARQKLIQQQRDLLAKSSPQDEVNSSHISLNIMPSARERAYAEKEITPTDHEPNPKVFTPAPIQMGKEFTSKSLAPNTLTDITSVSALPSLGSLGFTPMPLKLNKRDNEDSLFPKPTSSIEFDRSKHIFTHLVDESDLPSPLATPYNLTGPERDDHPDEFEQLPYDANEVFDGLLDDLIIDSAGILGELDFEAPPSLLEPVGLLGDIEDISDDFEDAFFALQTPLPMDGMKGEMNAKAVPQISQRLEYIHHSFTKLEWRRLLSLDHDREISIELLELTEMYIESGQFEMALDQLALSLLSPKPPKVILYLQAFTWCRLNRFEEAKTILESLYNSLKVKDGGDLVEGLTEVAVKLMAVYHKYDEIDQLNETLDHLQSIAPQAASEVYDILDHISMEG